MNLSVLTEEGPSMIKKSRKMLSLSVVMIFACFFLSSCSFSTHFKDVDYLKAHQEVISKTLFFQLDPKKKHIENITIESGSADGYYDNRGDVSGCYHIKFTAYVNHDKNKTLKAELTFPDQAIGPFTFKKPDPYQTPEKFDNWAIDPLDIPETKFWKFYFDEQDKIEASQSISESKESVSESESSSSLTAKTKEVTKTQSPLFPKWLNLHKAALLSVLNSKIESSAKTQTGNITDFTLKTFDAGLDSSQFDLNLNFTKSTTAIEAAGFIITFDDPTLKDLSKGATIDFGYLATYNYHFTTHYLGDIFPNQLRTTQTLNTKIHIK